MVWTNLLLFFGLSQAPQPASPPVNMHAEMCGQIPTGTGLRADGEGWIHIMQTGTYVFPNAKLLKRDSGPQLLKASQTYYVTAHKGPLEWIEPNGKRSIVPTSLLFPPSDQVAK